jgi:hypothetical protein
MRVYANPSLRNDRFVFKNSKVRFGILALFPRKFCQTSEVDQELECEMHQTKYKVMIESDMDWPP